MARTCDMCGTAFSEEDEIYADEQGLEYCLECSFDIELEGDETEDDE